MDFCGLTILTLKTAESHIPCGFEGLWISLGAFRPTFQCFFIYEKRLQANSSKDFKSLSYFL
jgi:hypothetical protein